MGPTNHLRRRLGVTAAAAVLAVCGIVRAGPAPAPAEPPPAAPAPAAPVRAPRHAAQMPSADDLMAAYEAGRYDEVLRGLQPVLALTGPAAEGYDRHALLRLKGETLLRMRATAQAAAAFGAAAAVAPDATAAATDAATRLLIQRSSAGSVYQPRPRPDGKTRPPVDIVGADARKDALRALFADELADRRPAIDAVASPDVRRLDQIAAVVPTIRQLRALELAATDDIAAVSEAVVGLDAKAAGLLKSALEPVGQAIDDIQAQATPSQQAPLILRPPTGRSLFNPVPLGVGRRVALTASQVATLRQGVATCREVAAASEAFAAALGGGPADFRGIHDRAEAHRAAAAKLLGEK
jgi:hypothetical protein